MSSASQFGDQFVSTATPEYIMHVGMGFWASKTLLSAVELGVFSTLADAPADLPTLQKKLALHQRSARDFLDALVALKLLERENGIYSNTADTDLFLDRAKPTYIGGILEMANARLYGFWGSLTEAVRTGELQNESKGGGENIFEALYADPNQLRGFLRAMSGVSAGAAHAIASNFPWRDYKTFMDLGAAQGMVPATLARAHPHLTGIGFDLPPVKPVFEEFIAQRGVEDRVRFQGGNFFEDPLPKVDVIVMGHILHDWDLAQKKMLLGKAFDALSKGGAVVVYDAIIDDNRRENAFGLMMSLNMLIETSGGFDYTGEDCQAWMREVGFSKTWVEPLVGPDSMVIGLK
ncbi:methyltransferase/methylase [Labrys miyagiensis]|uniref:Methyltransferase/methylase n=1 Tax=Labrys miyagiensis TaxID=346912 RepID=A0ABQ6CNV0_9HYPH|nr:methyltransferase/methylase [Labrys miyagiensis]